MNNYDLEYRGARLRVEVDASLNSRLFINGIQRDSRPPASLPYRSVLSSTVQTDYEWHEFIEAEVMLTDTDITITLSANKATLGSEQFPMSDSP